MTITSQYIKTLNINVVLKSIHPYIYHCNTFQDSHPLNIFGYSPLIRTRPVECSSNCRFGRALHETGMNDVLEAAWEIWIIIIFFKLN